MKFPSLTGAPVFFRTYSRKLNGTLELETPEEAIARSLTGTDSEILTEEEKQLSLEYGLKLYSLPSGRRLWFGGTENSKKPENVPGLYNCNSLDPRTLGLDVFRLCFDHLMLGCGVGVVVEREAIAALPTINNLIEVQIARPIPQRKEWESAIKKENTFISSISGSHYQIIIGDSRKGWIDAYMGLLEIAIKPKQSHPITVEFFFNFVRPKGTPIKGFGGTANPDGLPQLFIKIAKILNKAFLRKLTSVEVCLLLDEPASVVVSGNVRRSAGIRQGSADDSGFGQAKLYLWREDENGNWSIDPERDALRMANHTRVFHHKPTETECIEAVQQQYYSGEGAIQYAPEAIARANADILADNQLKRNFLRYLDVYGAEGCRNWLKSRHPEMSDQEINDRLNRYALNPCAEIIGSNFFCNLSEIHLNRLALESEAVIEEAFRVGAINACRQLTQKFQHPQLQYSREIDPIVGISFTGLFDFFVVKFGADYLRWWSKDRCSSFISNNPDAPQYNLAVFFRDQERMWLNKFRLWAQKYVWDFCDRHGLKRPNRYTTVQPSGCLDRTALRIFDQGLLYADEVVSPASGETVGLGLTVRDGIAANTAIANQPLNLVKVTLKNGRILRMTPNHRLSVDGEWVRADALQMGMEIDYSLGEYCKQEDALLLGLNPLQYTRDNRKQLVGHGCGILTQEILTPQTLNPELGYFIGCLFGDGAISKNKSRIRFSFNAEEFDLVERLQTIAQNCFGLTGSVYYKTSNCGELSFASKQLFDWLNLNGLMKPLCANLDRIPQTIRQSSRETILSFFCGLIDTDGCVRKQGSLSIDSANEAFIRNLQQVGEAVGLCFSIFHNTQGSNLQQEKNMWGLCLSRMFSQPSTLAYLNTHSRKCGLRPLPQPKRQFAFHPYQVTRIEFETLPDYSYDFAITGIDDNDSWYWQGGLKSHNTKSLLTGASPGWHPPKATRYIRRITFRKNDPVALACIDYGYNVIPSQSDKDENGHLLDDPYDSRCNEWLIEIPVKVAWAELADEVNFCPSKISALAQFDFAMGVQNYYSTHNTSATIELRETEIKPLGKKIFQAIEKDEGYVSFALLSRFDDHQAFPRLPFEPISEDTYRDRLNRITAAEEYFDQRVQHHLKTQEFDYHGPAPCDSDKCLIG